MAQYIYRLSLILLVISLSTYSIELSFLVSLLVFMFSFLDRANKTLINLTILLVGMVIVGLLSTNIFKSSFFNILKDLVYFTRPIFIFFWQSVLAQILTRICYNPALAEWSILEPEKRILVFQNWKTGFVYFPLTGWTNDCSVIHSSVAIPSWAKTGDVKPWTKYWSRHEKKQHKKAILSKLGGKKRNIKDR